jgi:hypothetical protein
VAKPTQQEAAAASEAAAADEARAEELGITEEQQDLEADAADKRARQQEQAAELKSVPEGALAPTEKTTRSGETTFARQWLIDNAQNVLGYDGHVVVGALHGDDREYLTVKETTKAIESWLGSVVSVDPNETEEAA